MSYIQEGIIYAVNKYQSSRKLSYCLAALEDDYTMAVLETEYENHLKECYLNGWEPQCVVDFLVGRVARCL
jgi:DNA-binding sugar fermentation-stimulating protein